MITQSSFRKVFEGVATRAQMFQMFDRHGQAPMSKARLTGRLYDGEWFEIGRAEHDYMFEILPPLWIRSDMFAMRECLTGSITSIFFSLIIDGRLRWFHAYCDLSDTAAPERMKAAIIERGSKITQFQWTFVDYIMGRWIHTTNSDGSRTYDAIHMHDDRLYWMTATVPKGYPEPGIFHQSLHIIDEKGVPIR